MKQVFYKLKLQFMDKAIIFSKPMAKGYQLVASWQDHPYFGAVWYLEQDNFANFFAHYQYALRLKNGKLILASEFTQDHFVILQNGDLVVVESIFLQDKTSTAIAKVIDLYGAAIWQIIDEEYCQHLYKLQFVLEFDQLYNASQYQENNFIIKHKVLPKSQCVNSDLELSQINNELQTSQEVLNLASVDYNQNFKHYFNINLDALKFVKCPSEHTQIVEGLNFLELEYIMRLLVSLNIQGVKLDQNLGILAVLPKQVRILQDFLIDNKQPMDQQPQIGSIDALKNNEFDILIISLVFVVKLKARYNIAGELHHFFKLLTKTKKSIYIVGDMSVENTNQSFIKQLIKLVKPDNILDLSSVAAESFKAFLANILSALDSKKSSNILDKKLRSQCYNKLFPMVKNNDLQNCIKVYKEYLIASGYSKR